MSSRHYTRAAGTAAVLVFAFALGSTLRSQVPDEENSYGMGDPEAFLARYQSFRAGQVGSDAPHRLRVRLGYVKGLSKSFTSMAGQFNVDLQSGAYTVDLDKLTPSETYGVWLVDVQETTGVLPLPDVAYRLATVTAAAATASVSGTLAPNDPALPPGFAIDRVVIVPDAGSPDEPLAVGTINVFQKAFFRRVNLDTTGGTLLAETEAAPALAALVPAVDEETTAASVRSVRVDRLLSRGANLFFERTFGGNGRTCGTCHPASNNLTIDTAFIATLPPYDPLFVAEFKPALAQLERPALMRAYGLILENVDGLDDPANKFVMRSVPHTLGMQVSLTRDTALVGAPSQMTGWSGDGAPGSGSLREFAIGAVTQHFTKRLNRVAGVDFRLPTERQLDAMEAFQLSLGRSADYDLTKITFQDPDVATGQALFVNGTGDPLAGGRCAGCHGNAGALNGVLENRNFNTNVEDVPHPARAIESYPIDGGFGQTANPDGSFGNRTFNAPPVVEAADTAPFFHNNVVDTLEGVVAFYSGPEFNGPRAPTARMNFNALQQVQIANFMRGINTLQNVDVSVRELTEFLSYPGNLRRAQDMRLQTAYDETQDAIEVLTDGAIFPAAKTKLIAARSLLAQAQASDDRPYRRLKAQQAKNKLAQARDIVAVETP